MGITEQWCSLTVNALHVDGLVESEFMVPRRINRLTSLCVEVAKRLKEISENMTPQKCGSLQTAL